MSALDGAPIGVPRAGDVATLLEQPCEREGTVGIPALVGPPVGVFGTAEVVARLEEDPDSGGGPAVAGLIGLPVEDLSDREILHVFGLNRHVDFRSSMWPARGPVGTRHDAT